MKKLSKLLILLLIVALVMPMSLLSCNNADDNDDESNNSNADGTQDGDGENGDSAAGEGIQLVKDGKAQFQVVVTSGAGGVAMTAADDFIERLRSLGVEIDDYILDTDANKVTSTEIIIGTGAKNRPDALKIDKASLGSDGYVIRAAGSRIVIAGATASVTKKALESFILDDLKITAETKSVKNLFVSDKIDINTSNVSIKIDGRSITDYIICYDTGDSITFENSVNAFNNAINRKLGKRLNVADVAMVPESGNRIVFKTVTTDIYDGFRVKVQGGDLIIECSYPKLLLSYTQDFVNNSIIGESGNVVFPAGYSKTEAVKAIKYSDFGAVGDGETNDFFNILRAHEYANTTGQKVVADPGKTYYISYTWDESNPQAFAKSIPVKTDVDWTGATFYINDKLEGLTDVTYGRHRIHIFTLVSDFGETNYGENYVTNPNSAIPQKPLSAIGANVAEKTIAVGQEKIEWLCPVLDYELNFVKVYHGTHRDFVRFGKNQDTGYLRNETFIMTKDGTILEDTRPTKEFTAGISSVYVKSASDVQITVTGGEFITNVHTMPEGEYTTAYNALMRGIYVSRANCVLQGVDHKLVGSISGEDKNIKLTNGKDTDGNIKYVSYPCKNSAYNSFVGVEYVYGAEIRNCKLSGHIEDAEMRVVDGEYQYKACMGSYDLQMNHAVNVRFINITQYRDINNQFYWGISASNGCKNLYFEGCKLSRVDAHAGIHNLTVKDTHLGLFINLVGTGTFRAEGVVRYAGNDFITLRNDYGATFNGNVEIVDCTFEAYKNERWNEDIEPTRTHSGTRNNDSYLVYAAYTPKSSTGKEPNVIYYKDWDFGYICYMPRNIYIDGFTSNALSKFYIFRDVENEAFESSNVRGGYRMTENVFYRNVCVGAVDGDGNPRFKGLCPNKNSVASALVANVHLTETSSFPWS